MTQRFLDIVRSAAVFCAIATGLRRPRLEDTPCPQPRIYDLAEAEGSENWLFDRAETPVSAEAYLLSAELSKASSALSGLRSLLSQMAALPDAATLATAPQHPVFAGDSFLFEGEASFDVSGIVPFEDSDLFIEHSPSWPKVAPDQDDLARVA